MNEGTNPISVTAESLRRAFDESFASAYPFEQHLYEVFIAIRAAGNPYAIRLKEISGLFTRKEIAPVPSSTPGLLGVASFRGMIVPVFDLGKLLGHSGNAPFHWLVLVSQGSPVSLAFDRFEGHFRVRLSGIPDEERARQIVSVEGTSRPVLHLSSILEEIRERAHGPRKER